MSDDREHVDDSDEYSQVFGVVIGHPPECELFQEVDDGYVLDATPNDELRALVEEWRSGGYTCDSMGDLSRKIHEKHANELEALLGGGE